MLRSALIKKISLLSIIIITIIIIIFKISTEKTPDLQSILNQSLTSSSSSIDLIDTTIENNNKLQLKNSKDDELKLINKINELNEKLLKDQETRLNLLESDRLKIEKQLIELRRPNSDSSLRERLAYMFPYDQTKKFPAYIWQTWKYGLNDENFGSKYKTGEEQWALKNPGFVHELFNDDTSNAIIHYLFMHFPEIIKAYELMPHIILKMDFFRYLMLFSKGGVYADVDTLPLQPIPNWIPENVDPFEIGMIIGIQSDPDTPDWRNFYARRLQFSNWVIQSKPGHPILREIIASITEETIRKFENNELYLIEKNGNFDLSIMEWTGAGIWTDVIFKYFNDYVLSGIFSKVTWKDFTKLDVPKLVSDVLVLPLTCFSPGIGKMGSSDIDHPLAFVKHYFEKLYQN
ncbi:glycosyltransferase family 32 protein [[Candida] arabinofermentans NRRL YB-2248]|uniref:Glycosyltransferase family 32 protein n=1 Tax=[Candida] arabinofermentans NRRL YB-2248 TaxID=983967 RepID=A0A1E4SUB6_9ASCO|nr:glycosyltransferase family 32 protein [[Candida] arabinofermentans NRRL YB-2248]